MFSVKIEFDERITDDIKNLSKQVTALKNDALIEYKTLTPIRSGNARSKTKLRGDTIEANYAYAERLDEGWSKQAPQGMTIPFEKWFAKQVKHIFGI